MHKASSTRDKTKHIERLYFKINENLLADEERQMTSIPLSKRPKLHETLYLEDFHKSVFACAAETIFFIENEQKFLFADMLKELHIHPIS